MDDGDDNEATCKYVYNSMPNGQTPSAVQDRVMWPKEQNRTANNGPWDKIVLSTVKI